MSCKLKKRTAKQISLRSRLNGFRFELVMTNPEDFTYSVKAEGSLQENEIKSRLKVASQLLEQHPESAILYSWSLIEATLRLVAEKEGRLSQHSGVKCSVSYVLSHYLKWTFI